MAKKIETNLTKEEQRALEVEQLLLESEMAEGMQTILGPNDQYEKEEIFKTLIDEAIDDPEAKYKAYYQVLQKLLNSYLPKGKKYATIKADVREEINTFLCRGKRKVNNVRGADSRQARLEDMDQAIDILIECINQRKTYFDTFVRFNEANKQWEQV